VDEGRNAAPAGCGCDGEAAVGDADEDQLDSRLAESLAAVVAPARSYCEALRVCTRELRSLSDKYPEITAKELRLEPLKASLAEARREGRACAPALRCLSGLRKAVEKTFDSGLLSGLSAQYRELCSFRQEAVGDLPSHPAELSRFVAEKALKIREDEEDPSFKRFVKLHLGPALSGVVSAKGRRGSNAAEMARQLEDGESNGNGSEIAYAILHSPWRVMDAQPPRRSDSESKFWTRIVDRLVASDAPPRPACTVADDDADSPTSSGYSSTSEDCEVQASDPQNADILAQLRTKINAVRAECVGRDEPPRCHDTVSGGDAGPDSSAIGAQASASVPRDTGDQEEATHGETTEGETTEGEGDSSDLDGSEIADADVLSELQAGAADSEQTAVEASPFLGQPCCMDVDRQSQNAKATPQDATHAENADRRQEPPTEREQPAPIS
jgi:hypothetical protein